MTYIHLPVSVLYIGDGILNVIVVLQFLTYLVFCREIFIQFWRLTSIIIFPSSTLYFYLATWERIAQLSYIGWAMGSIRYSIYYHRLKFIWFCPRTCLFHVIFCDVTHMTNTLHYFSSNFSSKLVWSNAYLNGILYRISDNSELKVFIENNIKIFSYNFFIYNLKRGILILIASVYFESQTNASKQHHKRNIIMEGDWRHYM